MIEQEPEASCGDGASNHFAELPASSLQDQPRAQDKDPRIVRDSVICPRIWRTVSLSAMADRTSSEHAQADLPRSPPQPRFGVVLKPVGSCRTSNPTTGQNQTDFSAAKSRYVFLAKQKLGVKGRNTGADVQARPGRGSRKGADSASKLLKSGLLRKKPRYAHWQGQGSFGPERLFHLTASQLTFYKNSERPVT